MLEEGTVQSLKQGRTRILEPKILSDSQSSAIAEPLPASYCPTWTLDSCILLSKIVLDGAVPPCTSHRQALKQSKFFSLVEVGAQVFLGLALTPWTEVEGVVLFFRPVFANRY